MQAGPKGPCARIHRNHSMAAPPGWAVRDRQRRPVLRRQRRNSSDDSDELGTSGARAAGR